MFELLFSGAILGMSNGAAPGPFSNIIISKTLIDGRKGGFQLSLAPFISDIFIISLAFFLVGSADNLKFINTIIPFVGAFFISYLAILGLRSSKAKSEKLVNYKFKDAVLINLFNPYPYIFWIFVGVPLMTKESNPTLFIIGFYLFFVLVKFSIVWLVDIGLRDRAMKVKHRVNTILSITMFYFTYKLIEMGVQNLS